MTNHLFEKTVGLNFKLITSLKFAGDVKKRGFRKQLMRINLREFTYTDSSDSRFDIATSGDKITKIVRAIDGLGAFYHGRDIQRLGNIGNVFTLLF